MIPNVRNTSVDGVVRRLLYNALRTGAALATAVCFALVTWALGHYYLFSVLGGSWSKLYTLSLLVYLSSTLREEQERIPGRWDWATITRSESGAGLTSKACVPLAVRVQSTKDVFPMVRLVTRCPTLSPRNPNRVLTGTSYSTIRAAFRSCTDCRFRSALRRQAGARIQNQIRAAASPTSTHPAPSCPRSSRVSSQQQPSRFPKSRRHLSPCTSTTWCDVECGRRMV
jgi:hypothetical protein